MSYVDQNLMPDEQVVHRGAVHWFSIVRGVAEALAGGIVALSTDGAMMAVGVVVAAAGIGHLILGLVHMKTTELVITSRRVIAKFGLIKRNTMELSHDRVESLNVTQSVIGRVLDFGTVSVNGTGGRMAPIPKIAHPLRFRRAALGVLEAGA